MFRFLNIKMPKGAIATRVCGVLMVKKVKQMYHKYLSV